MVGIYKITSPSGKVYIGQSWDIEGRFYYYRKSCAPGQPKLNNSFKKYGRENHIFEIGIELHGLMACQTELDAIEIFVIHGYEKAGFKMLNIAYGGMGGRISAETKEKLRETSRKHIAINGFPKGFGKNRTAEQIKEHSAKAGLKNKGRKMLPHVRVALEKGQTPESRERTRQASIGRVVSIQTKTKISQSIKGMKYPERSEEHRRKISENMKKLHAEKHINKGAKRTLEQRQRISEGSKGKNTAPWSEERKQKHSENLKAYYANRKII